MYIKCAYTFEAIYLCLNNLFTYICTKSVPGRYDCYKQTYLYFIFINMFVQNILPLGLLFLTCLLYI